jgi:hypothetical protein
VQVEAEFLPWLTQQAVVHVERGLLARSVVAALVADAVALRESEQQGAAALADAQAAAAEAHAAKASVGRMPSAEPAGAVCMGCTIVARNVSFETKRFVSKRV